MKKTLQFLLLVATLFTASSQLMAQDYVREMDAQTGHPLLHGQITFADLLDESTCDWLGRGASAYRGNENAIEGIKQLQGNYRFVLFVGTWCEDTQIMLPQFLSVMRQAGIPNSAITLYGVNRSKKALNQEEVRFNISRVPTIIVLHQNREIGRITETVNTSVEEDIYSMMVQDQKVLENRKAARGL